MCCRPGHCKFLSVIFVLLALVCGIFAVAMMFMQPPTDQQHIPFVLKAVEFMQRFFGAMIPVLGVGALFKYIFSSHHCSSDCDCREEDTCCTSKKK